MMANLQTGARLMSVTGVSVNAISVNTKLNVNSND
jgi:hypothetical protein